MKLSVFVGMMILASAGHAQIVPGSSGHGVPTVSCALNDTYKDVDSGLVWLCKISPTGWVPTPQYMPWSGGSGSFTPVFAFQGYGDSYVFGWGAQNPNLGGGFAQIARTIPNVPATNHGVVGANSDAINFNVWTMAQLSPQQPSAYLFNGGSNDNANCGISAACLANFKEEVSSSISYLTIPNQERVFGSACTQTSGTWTADTAAYPAPSTPYYLTPGTAVSAAGSGAVLTCTVPSRVASTRVGLNFQVTNAQTGTFTVTVDGVAQIDQCSGTTTFTSAPCGINLLTNATTIFRQEFAGTSGTSHTVVIATTNAAKVDVTAVDAITPQAQVNSSYTLVMGPQATFDNAGTYDAVLSGVANQFIADGARVAFADLQGTTPGVNSTTDIATTATANCSASVHANHPNDSCGQFHLAQTVVNAAIARGWNLFGTPLAFNGLATPAEMVAYFSTMNINTAGSGSSVPLTPVAAITVIRVEWSLPSKGTGCTTTPIVTVFVNSVASSFTIPMTTVNTSFNGHVDGILTVPSGGSISFQTTTGTVGCTTSPGTPFIVLHYVMQ